MMKRIFTALLMLLSASLALAQAPESFNGRVFNDRNANGIFDKGEKGIGGVAVSDGFSVVLTDADGCYSIKPAPRARFITVYTPDRFRNTNRFFCDVRGIMSGEGLSGNELNRSNPGLDFGLAKCKVYGSFSHMSDIEDREYMDWIDRMKEYAAVHDQDFIVVTGDICYESGLVFFTKNMNDDNVGRRMVYTIGNHDLIRGNRDYLGNEYGEKNFEDCFGPSWYSFNAGGVHFIVTPMQYGDARASYSIDDLRDWMSKDIGCIPQGTPIVIFNHDANEKLIPSGANVKAFVYGHRHDDLRSLNGSGIPFFCSMSPSKGSNDHSASALREFTFSPEGKLVSRMHYAPITNHIVAHAAGSVVRAVVYDAASEPLKAGVILPDGKKLPMHQLNDMMWEAQLPGPIAPGASYRVFAEFSDGEYVVARQEGEAGLKWMTTLQCKTFYTDPIISGGHLYIAGMDNENGNDCAVYSLDALTGETEWKLSVRNSIKGDMSLVDGVLYAGDVDYNVYAVNVSDGTLKWQKRVDTTFYPSFTEGIHASGGLVYAGCASSLCALDAATGETVWKNTHKHGAITNVNTNRTAGGALLTNGYWVGRYCYDAATGDFLWEKKDYDNRYSSSTPAVLDTTFIYTGYSAIFQVGARSGEILKSGKYNHIFNTRSEPLVKDGYIFVGSSNDGLVAVRMEDMSQAWNFLCEPAVIYTSPYTKNREKTVESSPAAYGENVVFGANDGFVYCLRRDNGRFVWRIKAGLPVMCKPQIVDDLLYFTDFAGNVYCYRPDF